MFIPQLLEEREPELKWPEKEALRFVYEYPVLPPGLLPSFIAKMHRFHNAEIHPWRRGCVLDVQGCRLRVIGDKKRRQVEISVAGGKNGQKRDALDQVRFKFEELHRAMTGMDTLKELIPVPGHPAAPMLNYRFLRTLENEGQSHYLSPMDVKESASVRVVIAQALGSVRGAAMKAREDEVKERYEGRHIIIENKINQNMSTQNTNIGGNAQGNAIGVGNSVFNKSSFNQGLHGEELTKLFETLTAQLVPLKDEMKGKDFKVLEEYLAKLTEEAQKPKEEVNTSELAVTGKGLIEAAQTVGEIAAPVLATVGLILKFLGVPLP
jgi:hypothetical protein